MLFVLAGMNGTHIKYFFPGLESKPSPDDDSYSHYY